MKIPAIVDVDVMDAEKIPQYSVDAHRMRVQAGAALLDKHMPGWADRIDLDKLALENQYSCVLGQLFPKPVTVPNWAASGYSSLAAAIRDSGGWTSDYQTPEEYWEQPHCVANYQAGIAVIAVEWGVEIPDPEEDYLLDVALSYAAADYGFNETEMALEKSGDEHKSWLLLEAIWVEEITARQVAA